ncbi:MAG: ABC transporter ATP-binding protein [Phycisphaeraceae bacterium]|nr:ABC transporter ATP-binding protein [Phycisphaeraceae bacterium]
MLEVRDIHKWYGPFHAVRGVSFSARRGEVVGLLGPNGAGKTTTIRMITGVFPPSKGAIEIDGLSIIAQPEQSRSLIGYLPESAPLYPEMSVTGYLHYRANLFSISGSKQPEAIERALSLTSLGEVRRKRIGALSKGFRQRVGLAAAALHQPSLLVLDEPANGLDPTQIRQMRETVRSLAKDSCVLLSSHILSEVELTCDRVVVIASGRVLADGTPAELRQRHAPEGAILIEVTEAEATAATIEARSTPGVLEVESGTVEDGWRTLRVRMRPSKDLCMKDQLAAIARSLHRVGVVPRVITPDAPGLERVFHSLLESAAEGSGAAA